MKWHFTEQNDYPQPRKGKGENDEFQCLVFYSGEYRLLYWNCYYQCWDDCYGDDYFCGKDGVEKWCSLDEIVEKLDT